MKANAHAQKIYEIEAWQENMTCSRTETLSACQQWAGAPARGLVVYKMASTGTGRRRDIMLMNILLLRF